MALLQPNVSRVALLQPNVSRVALLQPGSAGRRDPRAAQHHVAVGVGAVEDRGLPRRHTAQRLVELDPHGAARQMRDRRCQPPVRADLHLTPQRPLRGAVPAPYRRHDGVHGFTVGQRKGLGVRAPAADGRPRYVLAIEPASATVRVGPAEALDVLTIDAVAPVWSGGGAPEPPLRCQVQVRAHGGLGVFGVYCLFDARYREA